MASGRDTGKHEHAYELQDSWLFARCLAAGRCGVCTVVKRIWTPSWVLFSGGWCGLLMAGFYVLADVWNQKRWFFPLVVIGVNSIAAYCGAHLYSAVAFHSLQRFLGHGPFQFFGEAYEPLDYGLVILLGYWLALFAMYRKKMFLRL